MLQPCTIVKVPYKCSMDALVYLAQHDKDKKDRIQKEEELRQAELRKNRVITLESILNDVCQAFGQDVKKVKRKGRKAKMVLCRKIFLFVAKQKTPHTLKAIAKYVGRKDHSTAIHHAQSVADFIEVKEPRWMPNWEHYIENSKLFTEKDF